MLQYLRQRQKKSGRSISNLITDHWILITALAPALTSCMGVYEGGFECPPGEGVKCQSISEVNQRVNKSSVIRNQLSEEPACGESHFCSSPSKIWYWVPPEDFSSQAQTLDERKAFRASNSI